MMMVIMSVIPIGFLVEPCRHIRALARKIKRPALHKVQRRKYIPVDIDNPCRRVECLEPRPQGGLDAACFIEQIGFRQHQPVRDCRLLHRLHVRVERCSTIHRIDQRHDPVNTVPRREIRVRHHRLQNRRGISQPRRLDNNPVELLDLPRIALPHQIIEPVDQIAAHRAAQAPRGEQHQPVLARLDKQMIQPDLAEFIDDHNATGQSRIFEQPVEQCCFSGTEKARHNAHRNRIER